MRFTISGKLLPGIRGGISFGGRRKPRVFVSERIGRIRVTESTSVGKRRRKR